jgi:hypothetical protein
MALDVGVNIMSEPTISETLFEKLCEGRAISITKIPEGAEKTADFEIVVGGASIVAEVKQLDSNEHDIEMESRYEHGELSDGVVAKTTRVRDLIAKAYLQLKSYSNRGKPCIIVLFNNSFWPNYIDQFTVTSAMFGNFGVHLALSASREIQISGHGFLGKRKMTRNSLRGVSAVCVLSGIDENLHLTAYHNPFATNPLTIEQLAHFADVQYLHESPHEGMFVELFPVKANI